MPAGKRQQSNTMLYTIIIFVGLFIIATTAAVIYYVKFEEQVKIADNSKSKLNEMATPSEQRRIGTLVGAKQNRKSRLGTMLDYLDEVVCLIIGGLPEETSAEVKVSNVNKAVRDTSELLAQEYIDIAIIDPNTAGLIRIIKELKTKLDKAINAELATQKQLEYLHEQFDDAKTVNRQKEQRLLDEKEESQQQVNKIKQEYNELKALVEQTSEQRVQTFMTQLDEVKADRNRLNQELLKTQAQLKMTDEMMKRAQKELRVLVPPPDVDVSAFKPDGKIILIDDQTKIVHLNIGSDDRVYRGLTFSVYDRNMPIPKDGKGKAEIKVFDVEKNISAARITHSEMKRPILLGDIIANLIWDSHKANVFVIAGGFDLDGDGDIDSDAIYKIKTLIERQRGKVADTVSINTDFVVLGAIPRVREKPTFEEREMYPMAMERYQASLKKLAHYKEAQNRTQALSIPVFNYERFLYFIGYKSQVNRAGAF